MSTKELTKTQADLAIKPALNSLAQSSMFWRPDYLRPSPWLEHVPFLFWLVEAHQPRMAVTLGTGTGVDHFGLCQAVQRLRLETRCYFTCGEADGAEHSVQSEVRGYQDSQFDSFSYLLETSATRAASQFEDGAVDLLLLNPEADEDLPGLLARWQPKLSSRCLVLLPGVANRDPGCETFKAFETLAQQQPSFAFHHGGGLGAISVGAELSPLLGNLFDQDEPGSARQVVRDVFARLGRTCKEALQAREYLQKAEALEARLADQKQELDALSAEYESTRTELDSKQRELAGFGQRMEETVERHARERGQLAERVSMLQEFRDDLKSEAGQLRQRLDQQYRQVDERNQQLLQSQASSAEQLRELARVQSRAEINANELARAQEEQQRLQALSEQRQAENTELSARLDELERQLASRDEALEQARQERARETGQEQSRAEELDALKERLQLLEAERAGERDTLAKREEALSTQKILNDILKSELAEKEQQCQQAQSRAEESERNLADLERKAEDHERACGELKEQVQSKEEALAGAQASLEDRYRELAVLTELLEDAERKQADREASEEKARESEARIRQLESTIADLERRLKDRDSERILKSESEGAQSIIVDRLKAHLAERDAHNQEVQKRVEELERALESARGQEHWARQEKENAEKARAELNARCQDQDKRLEAVEQERDRLKEDRLHTQRRMQMLESNLADERDSVDERFRELALLTQMLEEQTSETRSLREKLGLDPDGGTERRKPSIAKHGLPVDVPFGRRARKLRKRRKELSLIEQSGLFDADWYLRTYPDVAQDENAAGNPALHYLKFGAFEGRNPGPGFDSQWYLDANPDVKDSGFNPLVHYMSMGRDEGRLPLPR